ncbi:MAG TPA: nucleotidyltransferase family protein [Anaerolineaceae bacterium]|nr:nucleotidyltransferase family protein [Anaerolineaceae bacterium]
MIAALVLAAGLSRRMGSPKMLLPWGQTTVVGSVVGALQAAEVPEILVVTGAVREELEKALSGRPVRFVHNPEYANGEMLVSLQVGLSALPPACTAALTVLGDQPQIQPEVVRAVCATAGEHPGALVMPSYQMRRGHPWILPARLWLEVQAIRRPQTTRDFLQAHAPEIIYVNVDTPTILMDLDTPEEYQKAVGKGA